MTQLFSTMNMETEVLSRAGSAIKEACFTQRLKLENCRCRPQHATGYLPTGASIKFQEISMQCSHREKTRGL